jgi:hypothetical protein
MAWCTYHRTGLLARPWHGSSNFPCGLLVPKPRGRLDPCLEFSPDVLAGSPCVRPNPPGSVPVATQIVTQLCQIRGKTPQTKKAKLAGRATKPSSTPLT